VGKKKVRKVRFKFTAQQAKRMGKVKAKKLTKVKATNLWGSP